MKQVGKDWFCLQVIMMPMGVCPICGRTRRLTRHHILKWKVFHNDNEDNIIYICPTCHNEGRNCLEELIRERENNLLRQHPELYLTALQDYIGGVRPNGNTYARKR